MDWNDIPTLKDIVPRHNAKLTHEQVREIRDKLARGITNKIISIDYGISNTTVSAIKYRQVYRRVL